MRILPAKPIALFALLISAVLAIAMPDNVQAQNARTAPSNAQPIDPGRSAAAKELLESAGMVKQFDTVVPLLTQQLEGLFIKLKPEHAAEIRNAFKRIPEKFAARKQELLDQIAMLYAQRLTTAELKEVSNFYKSPLGRKFVGMQAGLAQQSMALGRAWGQQIGQEIEQEIRSELRERGIEL
ncbi:MAG: DUF2059 domain-containing protein [Rhodomicrobium sp.]